MESIKWIQFNRAKNPYSPNILFHEFGSKLVFDGFFNIEDETMPVERIANINGELYHVRITYKKSVKDTSRFFRPITPEPPHTDDVSDDHCIQLVEYNDHNRFYCTSIIEMDYEIVSKINKHDRDLINMVMIYMDSQLIDEEKRDEEARKERIEREEEDRIYDAFMYRNSY